VERLLENVELWTARDAEPNRGASQYELILMNTKRAQLRSSSPVVNRSLTQPFSQTLLAVQWLNLLSGVPDSDHIRSVTHPFLTGYVKAHTRPAHVFSYLCLLAYYHIIHLHL